MPHRRVEQRQDVRLTGGSRAASLAFGGLLSVLDLSLGGAHLETAEWLAPGRTYPIRLSPGLLISGLVTRCALVRVNRSDRGNHPVYRVGVRFDQPSSEVRQQIVELLTRLRTLHDEPTAVIQLAAG